MRTVPYHSLSPHLRYPIVLCTVYILLVLSLTSCGSLKRTKQPDYYVAAYVWPSCHDDPVAHQYLWSEGDGEWEVIRKGNPRFEGHYQPRQPLWGYEHDDDPKVVEKWIDTALKHGVNTFVYDWYWFLNGPYLEGALDDGFLGASNNHKMNFYIMWANHTVVRNYWNYHRYGDDTTVLFSPKVDWDNWKAIVDRVITRYFHRPNYVQIDGCPVFAVFSIDEFIHSFADIDEAARAMDYFRAEAIKAGFKGIHLQENPGGGFYLTDDNKSWIEQKIHKLGINSYAFYNMGGFHCDYLVHGATAIDIRNQWSETLTIPTFPTVSIGWDDTPRFPAKGAADVTRFHNTPQTFENFLRVAKDYADSHPEQPRFIYINAWNEWVEGSYLLPDRLNGFGYLEAVQHVFKPANKDKD